MSRALNHRPGMRHRASKVLQRAQRGIILFIALIVLVAMSLTGIALMRSVDTNVMVAGNLAFRQGATSAADWGVEAARLFLRTSLTGNTNALDLSNAANAYYATWQATVDLYGATPSTADDFNWAGNGLLVGTDTAGNEVRYVIQRMCTFEGPSSGTAASCVKTATASAGGGTGSTQGTAAYDVGALSPTQVIYYRATVRVLGPRNTLSYVQAILR